MPTKNVVPQNNAEGGIGTSAKKWLSGSFVSGSFDSVKATDFSGSFRGDGSGITNVISSSYAITASYAQNAGTWDGIFTGSAVITGSFSVTGSTGIKNGEILISSSSPTISGSGGDFTICSHGINDLNLKAGVAHMFRIGSRGNWINPPNSTTNPSALVHISGSDGSATTAINILRVDDNTGATQFKVSASNGIKVGAAQEWSDGYLGNDEFIPLTPIDFCITDDGTPDTSLIRDYVISMPAGAAGRGGVGFGQTITTPLEIQGPQYAFAQKIIPKGFAATGVRVNTTISSNHINAWSGSILDTSSTNAALFLGNNSGSSNLNLTFNNEPVGDGETYVTVQCGGVILNGEIGGGKIFIQRI